QVCEDESGPALAEEGVIDRGFGVQKGHRSQQSAYEGEPCIAIPGADLCQRIAGTGARKRYADAKQQPANNAGDVGRGSGLQFHEPEAVEYRERNRARCYCGQKNLEHDEVSELHLSHDYARLKYARFFECEAENDAHGDADGDGESDGHDRLLLRPPSTSPLLGRPRKKTWRQPPQWNRPPVARHRIIHGRWCSHPRSARRSTIESRPQRRRRSAWRPMTN